MRLHDGDDLVEELAVRGAGRGSGEGEQDERDLSHTGMVTDAAAARAIRKRHLTTPTRVVTVAP